MEDYKNISSIDKKCKECAKLQETKYCSCIWECTEHLTSDICGDMYELIPEYRAILKPDADYNEDNSMRRIRIIHKVFNVQ